MGDPTSFRPRNGAPGSADATWKIQVVQHVAGLTAREPWRPAELARGVRSRGEPSAAGCPDPERAIRPETRTREEAGRSATRAREAPAPPEARADRADAQAAAGGPATRARAEARGAHARATGKAGRCAARASTAEGRGTAGASEEA